MSHPSQYECPIVTSSSKFGPMFLLLALVIAFACACLAHSKVPFAASIDKAFTDVKALAYLLGKPGPPSECLPLSVTEEDCSPTSDEFPPPSSDVPKESAPTDKDGKEAAPTLPKDGEARTKSTRERTIFERLDPSATALKPKPKLGKTKAAEVQVRLKGPRGGPRGKDPSGVPCKATYKKRNLPEVLDIREEEGIYCPIHMGQIFLSIFLHISPVCLECACELCL